MKCLPARQPPLRFRATLRPDPPRFLESEKLQSERSEPAPRVEPFQSRGARSHFSSPEVAAIRTRRAQSPRAGNNLVGERSVVRVDRRATISFQACSASHRSARKQLESLATAAQGLSSAPPERASPSPSPRTPRKGEASRSAAGPRGGNGNPPIAGDTSSPSCREEPFGPALDPRSPESVEIGRAPRRRERRTREDAKRARNAKTRIPLLEFSEDARGE
ncbi:hypothetical protein KM043_000272 [Ampulex compressa]|nr:hypothetical protein KM043_000272 [Ampulex compressa]